MKAQLSLLFFAALLASCGKPDREEQIAGLEKKIRIQEEKIRSARSSITALRTQLAELGADTIPPQDSVFITVTPVVVEDYREYLELAATVSSRENLLVSSEMGGRLVRVPVREGQRVGRGQVLAEVDGEIIRRQIEELENALSLARTVFEKRSRLWEQRIGSEVEYLQAENNVQSLEKSLATAQAQLEKTLVRSPISGTVDKVMLQPGEMAGPGAPIVRVVNLERVQVRTEVSEAYLGLVKPGDKVLLRFPTLQYEQEAAVSAVGQVIDPNNRTFVLEVDIPNNQGVLKPNLVGSINLLTLSEAARVQVPSRLVQQAYNGTFVFVVDTLRHLAIRRPIELGRSSGTRSVVESGLDGGEILIDEGFRNVTDSSFVQIRTL
jgi:membrane fusion protein (multidrug efflux system)